MRICIISYVTLESGSFQIEFLTESLIKFYGTNVSILIYEPSNCNNLSYKSIFRSKKNIIFWSQKKKAKIFNNASNLINAFNPDILILTHFEHFSSILKLYNIPKFCIYYMLEAPFKDQNPSKIDIQNHIFIEYLINLVIYPEKLRYKALSLSLAFKYKPSVLLLNCSPIKKINYNSFNRRNKKIIIHGALNYECTFIKNLSIIKERMLFIDLYGYPFDFLNDKKYLLSCKFNYKGLKANHELNRIRKNYLYSFVAWKPLSKNYLYACPNKFYESIAAGIPPIFAPHPQCIEIHKKFNIGIPINGWNQKNIELALNIAENILGTKKYKKLVENCLNAYKKELNWDCQFLKLIKYLPSKKILEDQVIIPSAEHYLLTGAKRKKFVLIDNSLRNIMGHHYTYDLGILDEVYKKNYEIFLACNKDYDFNVPNYVNLIPLFTIDFYGKTLKHNKIKCVDEYSGEIFILELVELLKYLNLTSDDIIFIPNIGDNDLSLLCHLLKSNKKYENLKFKIVIRHEVEIRKITYLLLKKYLKQILSLFLKKSSISKLYPQRIKILKDIERIKNNNFTIYGDTMEIINIHKLLGCKNLKLLPLPVNLTEKYIPKIENKKKVFILSYIGDARIEKGFLYLPKLIKNLNNNYREYKFVFNICTFQTLENELVVKTNAILKKMSKKYSITFYDKALSSIEYGNVVKISDIILTLYDPESYKYRSSHIIMESLFYGKVPILLEGSASSNFIKSLKISTNCIVKNAKKIDQKIMEVCNNWEKSSKEIVTLSKYIRETQSAKKVSEILLESNNE